MCHQGCLGKRHELKRDEDISKLYVVEDDETKSLLRKRRPMKAVGEYESVGEHILRKV